jgi:hypothetical protein
MAGVEIILAALAAGATAGVTNTASGAVQDAYTSLRDALRHRLRGGTYAEQILDEEADPEVLRARIGEDIVACGADKDDEILAAAQRLLALSDSAGTIGGRYVVDLREARGVQVGDYTTQHNTFS